MNGERSRQGMSAWIPRTCMGFLVLCGVTGWVYRGTLSAPFHFDDHLFLQSSRVTDPRAWQSNLDPLQLRQVTYLTFHLNYRFGGGKPASYHLVNLLIHMANAVLLVVVLRLLVARHPETGSEVFRNWLPWAAAGVFALHPVQSEPVNYVYQRSTLLAGFFVLISAAALLGQARGWRWRALLLAASLAYLLAIGSKESAVVFPMVVCAYAWSSPQEQRSAPGSASRARRLVIVSAAAMIALTSWSLLILQRRGELTVGLPVIGRAWHYALAQVQVCATYLRLILWPTGLTVDHAYRPAPPLSLHGVASALLLLAVVTATVCLRRKLPLAAFLASAFLLFLLPTSSIVPSADLMFEHRLYLPMLPGSALLVWVGWRFCGWLFTKSWLRQAARVATLLALLGIYGMLSMSRVAIWSDDVRLWRDAVEKAPWNPRAHYNLAVAALSADRREAQREFLKTVELQPNHAAALYNLGWIEQSAGSFSRACDYYNKALRADSSFWQAHQNLGNVLVIQGKLREAEVQYREVIHYRPDYWAAYRSLAALQLRLQEPAAALTTLVRLRELQPDLQDPILLAARALIDLHRLPEAEKELTTLESMDRDGSYREQIKALRDLMPPASFRPGR